MPEPTSADRRAAASLGLWGHAAELAASAMGYLRARLELAGIEAREASTHYGLAIGLAIGGLFAAILGYLLLLLAIVFAIAWACGGGNAWIWVLLGAALLHLLAAASLLFFARGKFTHPTFVSTLDEFRKDQAWLTQREKQN